MASRRYARGSWALFWSPAAGEGTRLGFDHPKGLFPVGPISKAPLFQILLEKLLAARKRYGAAIPLYIMTSPATHDDTLAALDKHERFGLPAEDVVVFCQGTMPAVDAKIRPVALGRARQPVPPAPTVTAVCCVHSIAAVRWPTSSGAGSSSCSTCRSTIRWSWSATRCSSATSLAGKISRGVDASCRQAAAARSSGQRCCGRRPGADHRIQRLARRCGGACGSRTVRSAVGGQYRGARFRRGVLKAHEQRRRAIAVPFRE